MKRAVYNSSWLLREAAKKRLFLLMAGPLRGAREGRAKKRTFLNLFFCCNLKIKNILVKTTYQNINTGNVGKVVVL